MQLYTRVLPPLAWRAENCFWQDEPRIYVESEDQPERMLLETRIVKEDGYQKQQGSDYKLWSLQTPYR